MPAAVIDQLAIVHDILTPMLRQADLQPLTDHLADDVTLTVTGPKGRSAPDTEQASGKAAVREYFAGLGDLVKCWRVRYTWSGGRVVVHAEESFILEPCGIHAQSELALVFALRDGLVSRLLVVEDPPALAASPGPWRVSETAWG